jgi:hypothetical protein
VCDEPELKQTGQRLVERAVIERQGVGHSTAPVEGRAGPIGREGEEQEDGAAVGAAAPKPVVVE